MSKRVRSSANRLFDIQLFRPISKKTSMLRLINGPLCVRVCVCMCACCVCVDGEVGVGVWDHKGYVMRKTHHAITPSRHHVIIIIKSEVSTLPIITFSVVVCLKCSLHHILSLIVYTFRENRDFVFIIIVQFMMSANIRIRFGLQIVFVCLYITPSHYHNCANFSEDIEPIKCLSDIFCRVCE